MRVRWIILAVALMGSMAVAQSPLFSGSFDVDTPFAAASGDASFAQDRAGRIAIRAVTSHDRVTPGQTFTVALRVTLAPDWVWYSPRPGGDAEFAPMPADLRVQADGLTVGPVHWPPHQPHETLGQVNNSYIGEATIYVAITVPADAAPGPRTITLTPQGQICGDEQCVLLSMVQPAPPATGPFQATVTVTVAEQSQANPGWTDELAQGLSRAVPADQLDAAVGPGAPSGHVDGGLVSRGLVGGFIVALLAGLILNIMPVCCR